MVELLILAAGASVGAAVTWWRGRVREREQQQQHQVALRERDEARASAAYSQRRLEVRTGQLDRATAERDDYAAIASTHDITPPTFDGGQWVRKVWKERRYSGHPSNNLTDVINDFEAFGEEHVLLQLDIALMGGWKSLLGSGAEHSAATAPISAGQALVFEGPAPRVLRQLTTFLCDDDTGFIESKDDRGVIWRDADSPMIWTLTVDVLQGQAAPRVERVEVLRVQEKIVEKIVEKPVVRALPAELTDKLCNHSSEELVTLIEAVLEVRELGPAQRLPAEQKALAGLIDAPISESPQDPG